MFQDSCEMRYRTYYQISNRVGRNTRDKLSQTVSHRNTESNVVTTAAVNRVAIRSGATVCTAARAPARNDVKLRATH